MHRKLLSFVLCFVDSFIFIYFIYYVWVTYVTFKFNYDIKPYLN